MKPSASARRALGATTLEKNLWCAGRVDAGSRAPGVFVFNPFAEGCIAQGRAFTPTNHQAHLARDLENLPQFLCRQNDIVLVNRRPSAGFLSGLKLAGFALPEFVELGSGGINADSELCRRKFGRLCPWAWGPDSVELFGPLFANVAGETWAADQRFNSAIAAFYSKAWSAELLRRVVRSDSGAGEVGKSPVRWREQSWLCTEDEIGLPVESLEEALDAITKIRVRGHHRIVVKEALGLAGSNAIRLWEPAVLEAQRRWMAKAFGDGRRLVIEPWLERALDFSVQMEMGPQGLQLCGFTGLRNDRKGQYQGNWAEADHHSCLPAEVGRLLQSQADIMPRMQRLYGQIFALLEVELKRAGFVGPVGIDALVYRTSRGDCRLKPIVEINPRYTMGRVLVELMKQTVAGNCGEFRLVSRAMARAEGYAGFESYARALSERHPLRFDAGTAPRIREGAVCLNDPAAARVCLAIFRVERDMNAIQGSQTRE